MGKSTHCHAERTMYGGGDNDNITLLCPEFFAAHRYVSPDYHPKERNRISLGHPERKPHSKQEDAVATGCGDLRKSKGKLSRHRMSEVRDTVFPRPHLCSKYPELLAALHRNTMTPRLQTLDAGKPWSYCATNVRYVGQYTEHATSSPDKDPATAPTESSIRSPSQRVLDVLSVDFISELPEHMDMMLS